MIRVLITEDHPMIADAYESYIKSIVKNSTITIVNSIERAKYEINQTNFDLAICDIQLGKIGNPDILSGIEIAELLQKKNNLIKLIIATSINDLYRINKINDSLKPNAFLIKNDFKKIDFKKAISNVMNGEYYFSSTVQQLLHKRDKFTNEFPLELKHFHLLLCMHQGYTNVKLEKIFNISNKTVLNWKNRIADTFNVSIKDIIEEAVLKGYI